MNKQISFNEKLVDLILTGKKTATWRIDDQKNLSIGDVCDFINSQSKELFATARLTEVFEKCFKDLTQTDKFGHESYESEQKMYEVFEGYYHKHIGPNTLVKVAKYKLLN
jgi:hypothetical protein